MFDRPSTPTPSDPTERAESRARLYALLANAWAHPESALVSALMNRETSGLALTLGSGFSAALDAAIAALLASCDQLRGRSEIEALAQLGSEHAKLFGHSVRGSCPPYELEYGQSEIIQQTAELADIAGFYRAFGMDLQESAFERGDHICVECEFLGVLCAKQAWALREGQTAMAETCNDAQRLFLRDHLARWAPAFSHRVTVAAPEGFYGRVAALTAALMESDCADFDIAVGPQWIELRPADPEKDAAIDCGPTVCESGAPEQLVQIGIDRVSPLEPAT